MGSHESIYELLGTYMKESERYSLALITELGGGEKNNKTNPPGFRELPGEKQVGLHQGKYKSLGPNVATGGHCQKGTTLTDIQQSPVIPETCGSCKNNPYPPPTHTHTQSPTPPPPYEPLPLSSHTAQLTGSERCVFSWGCPPWVWYMREWGCVFECVHELDRGCSLFWCQGPHHTTATGTDLDGLVSEWCCFWDRVLCQLCPT